MFTTEIHELKKPQNIPKSNISHRKTEQHEKLTRSALVIIQYCLLKYMIE